ncbi:MAG: phenylalanine--tRNA ligase subunit beta [Euryarchaeota archaeon]|nr:phenylalanine--tRNA ligase subunit beta [Euryarchaeota archaeon]
MPVITVNYSDIYELLGKEVPEEKIIKMLPMIGSDIEDYDEEKIRVEFFPNRPDHFSVEGIARTLKGFLEIEKGMPEYLTSSSGMNVEVDPNLADIRPYVSFCVVEDINLDEDKLKQLMEFQEDLHWVIGRDRKKVAIGIHNLDALTPPFFYKAAKGDEISFVPLESSTKMTLSEVLQKHKKGREYAHLVEKFDRYPLIVDSNNAVLSMPPIINGELTKLTTGTKNILIDVTGTDEKAVNYALNIIATSFAEAGGKIKTLDVIYSHKKVSTPDLNPRKKKVTLKNAENIIGIQLTVSDIVDFLGKVRIGAEILNENEIQVFVPSYRMDIIHEVDVVENIAVGYCFDNLKPEIPEVSTIGREDNWQAFDQILREIMVGMGFYETMSLMLTNEKQHFENMKLTEDDRVIVAQPISQDRTMIRKSLLNGLMEFLEDNKHEELPQKIFEIGEVVFIDESAETSVKTVKKLAGAVTHSTANFTEIKSIVDSLVLNLGLGMEIESYDHPSFIKGRCAYLRGVHEHESPGDVLKESSLDGSLCGFFGEVHPEVITNFNLEYPVIAFEVEFSPQKS